MHREVKPDQREGDYPTKSQQADYGFPTGCWLLGLRQLSLVPQARSHDFSRWEMRGQLQPASEWLLLSYLQYREALTVRRVSPMLRALQRKFARCRLEALCAAHHGLREQRVPKR
jgi:hypothetical protein